MGKRTLISPRSPVALAGSWPAGAVVCDSASNYLDAIQAICGKDVQPIRNSRRYPRRYWRGRTGMPNCNAQLRD